MKNRGLVIAALLTLIVAGASLAQTFLLTVMVTDQNRNVNQLAALLGDLAGVVSNLMYSAQFTPKVQSINVVYLEVVPDYGGATYDAYVLPASLNSQSPAYAPAGGTPPDNNITVASGVPIKFVITNLDTSLNQNFTSKVSVPFAVYNDSASGQVALQYTQGQTVSSMPISHTFAITSLGVNIPIPPDTVVVFTYTFTTPGVYTYFCATPCGSGMGLPGYMEGYITVTP